MVFDPAMTPTILGAGVMGLLTKLVYQVGAHTLEVTVGRDRWVPAVDGILVDRWFTSLADAWAAGVKEAMELDKAAPCSFVAGADAPQKY